MTNSTSRRSDSSAASICSLCPIGQLRSSSAWMSSSGVRIRSVEAMGEAPHSAGRLLIPFSLMAALNRADLVIAHMDR